MLEAAHSITRDGHASRPTDEGRAWLPVGQSGLLGFKRVTVLKPSAPPACREMASTHRPTTPSKGETPRHVGAVAASTPLPAPLGKRARPGARPRACMHVCMRMPMPCSRSTSQQYNTGGLPKTSRAGTQITPCGPAARTCRQGRFNSCRVRPSLGPEGCAARFLAAVSPILLSRSLLPSLQLQAPRETARDQAHGRKPK